jgi:SAM-dependent methyltransferase
MIRRRTRSFIRNLPGVWPVYVLLIALTRSFGPAIGKWPAALFWYLRGYRRLKNGSDSGPFKVSTQFFLPCLTDNRPSTPIEPVYFFQDTWAAGKIFALRPSRHYDVGSSVLTMAILSRWVPVTMVDIRPIDVSLEGLSFMKGSILDLPFADNSIESLSSLCVVEHIGLGRYGDDLDPRGSEKAIAELKRVLKPGGNLLLSVPVDRECRVYFNAHRAFTPDYLMRLLDGMTVVEQRYQYGHALYETYMPERGFGTGLFQLRKRAE